MPASLQITFDCADPDQLAHFWAEALGYILQPPPPGFASWPEALADMGIPEERWDSASAIIDPAGNGPRFFFQRVPESKTTKNRMHLDLNVSQVREKGPEEGRRRVDAEVERLSVLGGTKVRSFEQYGEYWIVMSDPEGNEFCLQ